MSKPVKCAHRKMTTTCLGSTCECPSACSCFGPVVGRHTRCRPRRPSPLTAFGVAQVSGVSYFWREDGLKSSDECLAEIVVTRTATGIDLAAKFPRKEIQIPELGKSVRIVEIGVARLTDEAALQFAKDIIELVEKA